MAVSLVVLLSPCVVYDTRFLATAHRTQLTSFFFYHFFLCVALDDHDGVGPEVDATGGGRSEVRFANFSFFSNCPGLPSATETGLTSMKLDADLTVGKPYWMAATRATLAR